MLLITDHCPALEELNVDSNDRTTAMSLTAVAIKCLKLKTVDMNRLHQEDKDNYRLHFPHIDWMAGDDEDSDGEEEDQDQDDEE